VDRLVIAGRGHVGPADLIVVHARFVLDTRHGLTGEQLDSP